MRKIELSMNEEKKYKVIQAVAQGRKQKKRASVELNLSIRQINRLLNQYKAEGKGAFSHKNKNRQPKHALSVEVKEQIYNRYLSFGDTKPNIVHFTEILREDYSLTVSDTTVRRIIYQQGIASPKSQRKTKKRLKRIKKELNEQVILPSLLPTASDFLEELDNIHPSRPRKRYCGELIQMDASQLVWFGNTVTHLHVAIDDASGNIVGGYFDTQETLKGYYHVLKQILTNYGIPVTFLTDKRTVFTYQQSDTKLAQHDTLTQFGFACSQLGIELRTSSIPQSKGRVERLNSTLQSRLPVDLNRHHITTIEEANGFLKQWIQAFNQQFGQRAVESVYEESPSDEQINLLLAQVSPRKIDAGHHFRFENKQYMPVQNDTDVCFTRHTKALVIKAFDGSVFVNIADTIYHTRELLSHELYSKEFDTVPDVKKERRPYIPPQSHPWKLASFKRYLRSIGKTIEDYQSDRTA